MRLTKLSDYALRVLMYAAAAGDRLITIEDTARAYGVSRAHLMKVVNILIRGGFLKGVRGRSGGFTLAKAPRAINLGAVIRATEPDFALVECFATGNQCVVTGACKLPGILNEALGNFAATLDRYSLADVVLKQPDFAVPKKMRSFGMRGPEIAHKPPASAKKSINRRPEI